MGGTATCDEDPYQAQCSSNGDDGNSGDPEPDPKPKDPCDTADPTNAKVISFSQAQSGYAKQLGDFSGLSSGSILALAAYESGFGISNKALVNNNYFGLTGGSAAWLGAIPFPKVASSGFACFVGGSGLLSSGENALFSQDERYLCAAMGAQNAGGDIAAIANAIAAAGFNSEYSNGGYGTNVNGAAQAIAARINCP